MYARVLRLVEKNVAVHSDRFRRQNSIAVPNEADDLPPLLFGWPASGKRIRLTFDLHQGDLVLPGFAALVGFGVQLCGLGSRAAAFAERENGTLSFSRGGLELERI